MNFFEKASIDVDGHGATHEIDLDDENLFFLVLDDVALETFEGAARDFDKATTFEILIRSNGVFALQGQSKLPELVEEMGSFGGFDLDKIGHTIVELGNFLVIMMKQGKEVTGEDGQFALILADTPSPCFTFHHLRIKGEVAGPRNQSDM